MIIYNKLIRDKIPEVIAGQGKECEIRTLEDGEYFQALNEKFQAELDEYKTGNDLTNPY